MEIEKTRTSSAGERRSTTTERQAEHSSEFLQLPINDNHHNAQYFHLDFFQLILAELTSVTNAPPPSSLIIDLGVVWRQSGSPIANNAFQVLPISPEFN